MKLMMRGALALLVSSLCGCEQALVEFYDQSVGYDLSASGSDLAGADLRAAGDLANADAGVDGSSSSAPRVIDVNPDDLSSGVPTFRKPTATFDRAMNAATINSSSFQLKEQGAVQLVNGTVSYDPATHTATFKPTSELLVGTTYVATITTAVRDTSGTTLAAPYTFSFATASQACGMAPVALGSAGNFGVFAGTTITNAGPTIVNGDIGVSPGAAIVGFGAGPGIAGPGIVNGTQRTPPDPAAAQAMTDLTTALNDAAGRSLCFVNIADGELGGKVLTPGLYRSGISSFAISGSDLTLDAQGDADAVFIFQTSSSSLTVANGRAVILAGGAKASNVVWSVGTAATIGTTASMKGTILADQAISFDTNAKLEGRALARVAAVTLLSNVISVPAP